MAPAKVSCQYCSCSGPAEWVCAIGNHHNQRCPRYRNVKCFTCKTCECVGTPEWVTAKGSHHSLRCERYSWTKMAQCQYCDVVATPAEVTKEGSHHATRCPRFRREDTAKHTPPSSGVCKYCGYQGPIKKVTAAGSHHSSTCPRYKDPASEGCWWPFCNACSASPATSLEHINEKEKEDVEKENGSLSEAPAKDGGAEEEVRHEAAGGKAMKEEVKEVKEQAIEDATMKVESDTVEDNQNLEFKEPEEATKELESKPEGGLGDLGKKPDEAVKEAPEKAPETLKMQIQIPAGVQPGQALQVQTPSGQLVQVVVPPGTAPGATLMIEVPA